MLVVEFIGSTNQEILEPFRSLVGQDVSLTKNDESASSLSATSNIFEIKIGCPLLLGG